MLLLVNVYDDDVVDAPPPLPPACCCCTSAAAAFVAETEAKVCLNSIGLSSSVIFTAKFIWSFRYYTTVCLSSSLAMQPSRLRRRHHQQRADMGGQ